MPHCPECLAEFQVGRPLCSDCGVPLVDGPSPRYEGAARSRQPSRGGVPLTTVRGAPAAAVLGDLLADEGIPVGWADGRTPDPDGDPEELFGLCVAAEDVDDARRILAEWEDPEAVAEPTTARTGAARPEQPELPATPRAGWLPMSDLRHCPACGGEFDGSRTTCTDCDTTLVDGPSSHYEPAVGSPVDDEPFSPRDFAPLALLADDVAGDLCDRLAGADVPCVLAEESGWRMYAPGREPFDYRAVQAGLRPGRPSGRPGEYAPLPVPPGHAIVGVSPDDFERAHALLEESSGRGGVVERGSADETMDTFCAALEVVEDDADDAEPPQASAKPPRARMTSLLATMAFLTALVVLAIVAWKL